MKKFTRFTYINLRVFLGIIFAISIVGIFLNEDHSVKSDYMFNAAQSGMFLMVSLLPMFMKKFDLDIPDFVYLIFIFFCLAHFLCGEILGFFVKIKWWDSALHTFSGMLIALLSFSLVNMLNKSNGTGVKLNLAFTIIFAFSVTITIGVMWEILEFAFDQIAGLNMQRAYVSTMSGRGEPLVGSEAIMDTMKDLILDSIGAAIVCIVCAIFVKKNKVKIEDLTFIKKRVKPAADLDAVVSMEQSSNEQQIEEKPAAKQIVKENKPKRKKKQNKNTSN